MTILSDPVPTHSVKGWKNIANQYFFYVQERHDDMPESRDLRHYLGSLLGRDTDGDTSDTDGHPFRILFSRDSDERNIPVRSNAPRVVVAVSNSLGGILEEWGWILQSWAVCVPSPATRDALTSETWSQVHAHIKTQQLRAPVDHPIVGVVSGKAKTHTADDAPVAAATISPGDAITSNHPGDAHVHREHASCGNHLESCYDTYDITYLRVCDVWSWVQPQVTTLLLMASLGCSCLRSFTGLCGIMILYALPIGSAQYNRPKEVPAATGNSGSQNVMKQQCARDAYHLMMRQRLHETWCGTCPLVKAGLAVLVTLAMGALVTLAGPAALDLGCYAVAVCTLVVSGAWQLRGAVLLPSSCAASDAVTEEGGGNSSSPPLVNDISAPAPPPPGVARGGGGGDHPTFVCRSSASDLGAGSNTNQTPVGGGSCRYRLPALTDKEMTIEAQLTNYGAPFSLVLLKPLREWNSSGWTTAWERAGLRCEERMSDASKSIDIRLTAHIPHANVGTLQHLLLDDVDYLDAKSTWAYQYNPLLAQRCLVRKLGYNLFITLTRLRSPVYGVPPLEVLQYVSPAILLDEAQQEALQLRRPFGAATPPRSDGGGKKDPNSEADASAGENTQQLMAFVQCGIPCPPELHPTPPCQPPHERGVTMFFCIIGLEEEDGSLTLGFYQSLHPNGILPPEWAMVYKSAASRQAYKLMELLMEEGPKPNQVSIYRNLRPFQPLAVRQTSSEVEDRQASIAAMSSSRRAAARSRDEANLSSAFLTPEMRVADTTPTHLLRRSEPWSGAPSAAPGSTPTGPMSPTHCHRATLSQTSVEGYSKLSALTAIAETSINTPPRLVEKFLKQLLACTPWTLQREKDSVRYYDGKTPLSRGKATRTEVFIPKTAIEAVANLLMIDHMVADYDCTIDSRVTVTPVTLQKLLLDSVVVSNDHSNKKKGNRSTTPGSSQSGAPPGQATQQLDFARECYHGCMLRYTQYKSPMWGASPRDTVTRVSEPYYMTVGDVQLYLQSQGLHNHFQDLSTYPPSTKLFILCGEDAGNLLPPFKRYQRAAVPLFGWICWEASVNGESGMMLVFCEVTSPLDSVGSIFPTKLVDRGMQDQVKTMRNIRAVMQDVTMEQSA